MMKILGIIVACLALLTFSTDAAAHGMRTGTLRIDEVSPTRAFARWTTTVPRSTVTPSFPAECKASPVDVDADAADSLSIATLECPGGIAGRSFGVTNLGEVVNEATVFVKFLDGHTASHLLTPKEPAWPLPTTQSAFAVAASYVRSGLLHIATGADHLLFLVLLVLVLRKPRAVLLAETAFTISHSLAFSATALGLVHVRAAPAEACIALSLVLLALDVKKDAEPNARRGALVALVFGLVHGLGFAGGLSETGLPDAHVAVALVGFGVGVEIGQVAFLLVVLLVVTKAAELRPFPKLVEVAAVAIGGLATAWFVERVLVVLAV